MAINSLQVVSAAVLFCGCVALTERGKAGLRGVLKEWKYAIIDVYRRSTEYINRNQYDRIRDLFSENSEEMVPEGPVALKNEVVSVLEDFPYTKAAYFGFLELLYASADEAVAWHVGYVEQPDGTTNKSNGISLFVQEKGDVKFKLNIFTSD